MFSKQSFVFGCFLYAGIGCGDDANGAEAMQASDSAVKSMTKASAIQSTALAICDKACACSATCYTVNSDGVSGGSGSDSKQDCISGLESLLPAGGVNRTDADFVALLESCRNAVGSAVCTDKQSGTGKQLVMPAACTEAP